MVQQKKLKAVFTLKSGKSIVIHMFEDECFKFYDQWINYNRNNTQTEDPNKINISKKAKGVVIETVGILLEEIAAIQIGDSSYNDLQ